MVELDNDLKESISNGEKIMLFISFPIVQLSNMVRLQFEKLTEIERKLIENKAIYIKDWQEFSFEGVKKFLVMRNGDLYLVRIHE